MKIPRTYKLSDAKAIAGDLIPFRAPHRTTSTAALLREYRLAIGGVLYLEELGNFPPDRIRALARAISDGGSMPLAIVCDMNDKGLHGLALIAFHGSRDANLDELHNGLAIAYETGRLAIANDTTKR